MRVYNLSMLCLATVAAASQTAKLKIPFVALSRATRWSLRQPANVTWGLAYLEFFKVFPRDTKYTIGVIVYSGKKGEDTSVSEARAFCKGIGDDLFATEVDTEFDGIKTVPS